MDFSFLRDCGLFELCTFFTKLFFPLTNPLHFSIILRAGRKRPAIHADVAELADALDLGSSVPDVQVQVLSSALKKSLDFI